VRSVAQDRPAVERAHPPDAVMKLVNPLMRRILTSRFRGKLGNSALVLHYVGRRSGNRYDLPVGYHDIAGQLSLLTNSAWRVNFRNGRALEVTLRGERRPADATLIEDPATVAATYRTMIEQLGLKAAQRRLGIRINVDRVPTEVELADMVRRSGLSIVEVRIDARPAGGNLAAGISDDQEG
jgi:hypothetical protein